MLFFLTCFYIAFYYIRPTEWVPGILGVPIFNLLGIVSVVALLLASIAGKIRLLQGEQEKMMAGFIAAIILSHASHTYLQGMIDSINGSLPTLVGYFLVVSTINSRDRYNKVVMLLIILTTFLAFEGWLQYTTGFAHGGMEPLVQRVVGADGDVVEQYRVRWYGVLSDPNDLGLALVIVVPFLLEMVFRKRFVLPIVCLPLVISAIYYTNSRGSFLAFLAAIGAYFVIRYRSKTGFIIGIILAIALFSLGPSRMAEMSSSDGSMLGRIEAWHQGFQMFKANPLFGVGQGMFTEDYPLTAHNSFVLVMAELGLVGLFFYTGLIYYPFNWLWRNVFLSQRDNLSTEDIGQLSAIFSSFIGMLAAMFFLSRSYDLVPFMMMAMAMTSTRLFSPAANNIETSVTTTQKHYRNIALLTLLQIIIINLVVKMFL
jgi:O-antigen ligase